jgi:hypothetical protein
MKKFFEPEETDGNKKCADRWNAFVDRVANFL